MHGEIILKYPLRDQLNHLHMNAGARVLCVQMQNDMPTL